MTNVGICVPFCIYAVKFFDELRKVRFDHLYDMCVKLCRSIMYIVDFVWPRLLMARGS